MRSKSRVEGEGGTGGEKRSREAKGTNNEMKETRYKWREGGVRGGTRDKGGGGRRG